MELLAAKAFVCTPARCRWGSTKPYSGFVIVENKNIMR